jgi:hypothetical protein
VIVDYACRCGSPGFAAWLTHQPEPGLPLVARERSLSNVGSVSQSRRASVDASLGQGAAARLAALDVPVMMGGAAKGRRASMDVPPSGRAAMFAAVPANKATRFLDVVKSVSTMQGATFSTDHTFCSRMYYGCNLPP